MNVYAKPLPRPTALSRPFWNGARQSEIKVQRCRACGHMEHPPRVQCTACWSDALEWINSAQEGVVYSYTVCHWPTMPEFKSDAPYIVAIVQLPEGIRLSSNIIDCPLDRIAVGLKVRAVFEKATDDVTLIKFKPV